MHNLPYNGRKPLIRMPAMKKIARFVALAVASSVVAGSAFAQNPVYRVRDLVVDAVAPSAADASLQGRNAARLVGAQRLIERLTLPEDRASARSPLEASAVAQLYRSYQTQGEMKSSSVSGGIRATGLVTWTFEEDRVRGAPRALGLEGYAVEHLETGEAALARIAGYGVTAEEVWEASDEPPLVLEVVSYTLNMDGASLDGASMAGADGNPGAYGIPEAGEAVMASATATAAGASAAPTAAGATTTRASDDDELGDDDRDTWPPAALESFLRQAELDPDLQQALATAADAAAVAAIARAAGHPVTEEVIWEASDETPEALKEPEPPTALADPWASEGSESSGKQV
jgi:hypothetical protein